MLLLCAVISSKFLNLTPIETPHCHYCNYATGPTIDLCRILFPFNSCYVILIEWTFHYFVMYNCMSTTVCVSGTVQFTFFLVTKLSITISTSCNWLTVTLIPVLWFHGVVDITTAQLHSTKSELRFWAGSNPTGGMSEIRDCKDL